MTSFAHPVVLITGASRGLGLETARLFARRNFGLIITARGSDALSAAQDELVRSTEVVALPGDVSDPIHVETLVARGIETFGHIDVLVNNASELGPSPLTELDVYPMDSFERVLAVNVAAPLRLAQLALPGMKARGWGVIVNVTSDAGVEAYPTWGGYGASKAALEHLSKVLAAELDGTGIRVYVLDPGDMNTQMHQDAEPGVDLSRLPHPSVSAPAILYLAEVETRQFGRFLAQDLATTTPLEVLHAGA